MQLAPKISYSFHNHILKANFVSSDFARCSQEVMGDVMVATSTYVIQSILLTCNFSLP